VDEGVIDKVGPERYVLLTTVWLSHTSACLCSLLDER
jgi:hypothetical protein